MSRSRRAFAGLLVALVSLTAASAAAGAVQIKRVYLGSYPFVRVTVLTSGVSHAPGLLENGRPAPFLSAYKLQAKSVVLAVDRSRAMSGAPLANATAAAHAIVTGKPDADRVALFGFGSEPLQLTSFAKDTIDAESALRSLSADGGDGTRLYDTVVRASLALNNTPRPRVLIVLTNGRDDGSSSSLEDAIDTAKRAEVSVYPIGIRGDRLDPKALRTLARETGGTYHSSDKGLKLLTGVYSKIATELKRTWILTYYTAKRPGDEYHLVAKAGKLGTDTAAVAIPKNEAAAGDDGTWVGNLRTHWWGAALIGLAAAFVVIAMLVLIFGKPRQVWLKERLEPWTVDRDPTAPPQEEQPAKLRALTPLFTATENKLQGAATWRRLERVLEQSDSTMRPAQVFWMSIGIALCLVFLGVVIGVSPFVIVVLAVLGAVAPYTYFQRKATKRLQAFETQLPASLNTMAGSLKAGHSFRQAMQTLVEEGGPPIDIEFNRVLTEARLGRPIEAALADMGQRIASTELDFALRAVTVQQQVGGSLAGLFELLAETLTQRQQFRNKVRALTAQGRLTAWILIGLPFGVAFLLSLVSPGYLDPLFNSGTGQFLIGLGIVMMIIGSLILKKITSFKGYR